MIPESLFNLLLCVHHKWPILYNGLSNGLSCYEQEAHAAFTLCCGRYTRAFTQDECLQKC